MAKRGHNHSDCRATKGIGTRYCRDCKCWIGTVMYDRCRQCQDIFDLRIITAAFADTVYRPPVPWYGLRPST